MKRLIAFTLIFTFPFSVDGAKIGAGEKSATGFQWVDRPEQGTADLQYDGKPVLRYMYAFDRSTPERTTATFKVYHHVFGPETGDLITNGPEGLYPHHRGMFVGWRETRFDGGQIDSWHCTKGAHQRHVKFLEQKGDRTSGSMTSEITWNDGKNKPVIDEIRTVRVTPLKATNGSLAWQIDWTSKLTSQRGKVDLSGDRQHAGFQFRAAAPIAKTNSATYIRPKGFPQDPKAFEVNDKKDPNAHINLGWLAMSYEIEGTPYTVTYFEDPSLPKPSRFSERPYGRFGAYFQTTLEPDKPLTMRYRLIVTSGKPPAQEAIQAQYDQFVAELARSAPDSK